MDHVVVAGLKALVKYKEAIEEAKEQVEKARQLAAKIEMFEVTLTMISMRGLVHDDYLAKVNAATDGKKDEDEEKGGSFDVTEAVAKLAEKLKDKAVDFAKNKIKGIIDDLSPIGRSILSPIFASCHRLSIDGLFSCNFRGSFWANPGFD
jgi:hypothetical protein